MKYESGKTLQEKLVAGAELLANNVGSTLGPKGRPVLLQRQNSDPLISKDGVTVAKFIASHDPFENMAIKILRQAAEKTANESGDGTTTTTILASEILSEFQRYGSKNLSVIQVKKGIDKFVDHFIGELKCVSKQISSIDDIRNIAKISSGENEIADLVSRAYMAAGKSGAISIDKTRANSSELVLKEGYRCISSLGSPQFIVEKKSNSIIYENAVSLVTDEEISTVEEMLPAIEQATRLKRPLVIFCNDIQGQALAALILNAHKNNAKVIAVKPTAYGEERTEILREIALITGAKFFAPFMGSSITDFKVEDFGGMEKIEATRTNTTIVSSSGDTQKITEEIEALKQRILEESEIDQAQILQNKVSRLSTAVALIRLGANSEAEYEERKMRLEDALEAVQSARAEGIVPGGSLVYLKASRKALEEPLTGDEYVGVEVMKRAVLKPFRRLIENAGLSADVVMDRILSDSDKDFQWGFDVNELKYCDLLEAGIIEPTRVIRTSIINAASAAGTLLMVNNAVSHE